MPSLSYCLGSNRPRSTVREVSAAAFSSPMPLEEDVQGVTVVCVVVCFEAEDEAVGGVEEL